jgi:hypothetical protein
MPTDEKCREKGKTEFKKVGVAHCHQVSFEERQSTMQDFHVTLFINLFIHVGCRLTGTYNTRVAAGSN